MGPRLVVVGSANQDLIVRTERIPVPGETVLGGAFITAPGGKGANQAVAAARLGAEVTFVGRVGADTFGDSLLRGLAEAGIDVSLLRRDAAEPSGVALIGVDKQGENAIIVAPGANHKLTPAEIDSARTAISQAAAVIAQLEIPLDVVRAAALTAHECGVPFILNPAPVSSATQLPDELLSMVAILTPNEHEAAQLIGELPRPGLNWADIAQRLRDRGPAAVVITLGEIGCVVADGEGTRTIPACAVHAIDTTAAGDCFTAALAVGIGEGLSLDDAARFAGRAAALSVTRVGAQPSLPTRDEVDAFVSATA